MDQNNTVRTSRVDEEQEIDLLELARVIWKKIWIVAIGFIVGAILTFGVTRFFITPLYRATSSIYIFDKSISSLADIQIGSNLTSDFRYIAVQRDVIKSVIDELSLDLTVEQLSSTVSVTNPSGTHILEISATNPSPVVAANIANSLSDKVRDAIADIMNTDRPSVIQRAVIPTRKASPSTTRNTMIGALVGALLMIAIITIQYLLDDTIKTDEDVKKYLQLDTLAQIPYVKGLDEKGKASSSFLSGAKRRSSPKSSGKSSRAAK